MPIDDPRRLAAVEELRDLAAEHGVPKERRDAGSEKVEKMAVAILGAPDLPAAARDRAQSALEEFRAAIARVPPASPEGSPLPGSPDAAATTTASQAAARAAEAAPAAPKEWRFRAAQLIYNNETADWASTDKTVLAGLFNRLCAFAVDLGKERVL